MRKKLITLDGMDLTISPLNLLQVDELAKSQEPGAEKSEIRARRFQLLLWGLNNAEPVEPWTEERIQKEFDLLMVGKVTTEILALSGLESTAEVVTSAGETSAASQN
jgi:hypothetical protein